MLGEKIRALRAEHKMLLRQLAAQLDMDSAMLSKMERGERFFRKENLSTLSEIFNLPEKELQILWLADKILKVIEDELHSQQALTHVLKSLK